MATIVILQHRLQKGFKQPYLIHAVAEHWLKQNHQVILHYGIDKPPPGDVAIVNIDLTVIPSAYLALFDRYEKVVNCNTPDISKRAYSQLLITQDSDWDGPVIVKTNANFGGRIERRLQQRAQANGIEIDFAVGPTMANYPVFEDRSRVPGDVWDQDALIVEKFLPERDAKNYYMRVWVFLGEAERSYRMRAESQVIKSHDILEREVVEVPKEIRTWRERLGFDFGKFDYVIVDGKPILIDANRTPGAPHGFRTNPEIIGGLQVLSSGLATFLERD